ncbi:28S ribosomal protein S28, mitochondrial [Harmonia axyridis]|uniref:28S ribosomal protein S28, mitochondrial n=1 Tax=Harmonia axyridis TaxID=115357 RepID=UPI001E275CE7|nr:28S ribosomal protein S28, mitochondrial [Harmonia axyridis]
MLRVLYSQIRKKNLLKIQSAFFSDDSVNQTPAIEKSPAPLGFAKSYEKFEEITKVQPETPETFETLLRNSKFIDLGDPSNKIVIGKIFHVVEDDLYIDFGWKFHCVCPRPKKSSNEYVRGARVRLQIKDLELSSKFLGYEKDLTLLEANCFLLGLVQDRSKKV